MRNYAVMYNAATNKYQIMFRDYGDPDMMWYAETAIPPVDDQDMALKIAESFNA